MTAHRPRTRRLLIALVACTTPLPAALAIASHAHAAPARAHVASVSVVRIQAAKSGALRFTQTSKSARRGKVTILMSNPGSSGKRHGIAVQGRGVDKDGKVVAPGGTSRVTVTLKPGRYAFYCPVSGHEKAGMKGTLIVR